MMSSLMPSEKYSCSGSPLMLAKGRTQIDRRCAAPEPCSSLSRSACARRRHAPGARMFFTVCSPRSSNAHGDLSRHLVANGERDRDAADGRERLQPRGNVDAFAIDVVAFDDDIAEIDADTVANGARPASARAVILNRQCS